MERFSDAVEVRPVPPQWNPRLTGFTYYLATCKATGSTYRVGVSDRLDEDARYAEAKRHAAQHFRREAANVVA